MKRLNEYIKFIYFMCEKSILILKSSKIKVKILGFKT